MNVSYDISTVNNDDYGLLFFTAFIAGIISQWIL